MHSTRTTATASSVAAHSAGSAASTSAAEVLQQVFGYPAFRGSQAEIVDHVVAGGDALVLMPTGGGKSLCYQVPALVRHRAGQGVAAARPLPAADLLAVLEQEWHAARVKGCA